MAFGNGVTALVAAIVGLYLYFGGRFSIAIVLLATYGIFYTEAADKTVSEDAKLIEGEESSKTLEKKHACKCKGKGSEGHSHGNGGCCSSKKNGPKTEGGCCSTKKNTEKAKSGGCCSSKVGKSSSGGACCSSKKKNIEDENIKKELDELTIDFTDAFKTKTNGEKKSSSPKTKTPKVFNKSKDAPERDEDGLIKSAFTISNEKLLNSDIYVFYSSLQGSSGRAAEIVETQLKNMKELVNAPTLINLDELDDIDSYFVDVPSENALYVLVLPSYDVDCPLDYFLQTLEENFNDFRLDRYPLRKLVGYTVLGLGDSESWPEKFCYQAKKADHWIAKLGGRRIFPVGEVCMKYGGNEDVEKWANLLGEMLRDDEPILYEYDETISDEADEDDEEEFEGEELNSGDEGVADVEDLAGTKDPSEVTGEIKQMVAKNSPTYKNLTKQGYKIVGSHSGVKVCRWTKNELRGRGSCYKKSLFNIASSRCMELTPSLACSSKCVFCWRHGTNPVSKNWRWETDEPEFILENALLAHYSMIKQMRGVPGVIAERFADAFKVAHCALSLVGEPILYPHISRFIELLHEKDITSFLVCNAQHPQSLRSIGRVTQLYVSIDAPTKQELKKVDRPLYKDFWERMMECLDILRTVQSHQRTVFRLTLVKGFNMSDISAYADLVDRGQPCFIEVKGATFSGSSKDNVNSLTMQNIPFNEECKNFVESFVEELQRRNMSYEVAAEHAHSNCILIANTKFKIDGEWYTHINFERFFELLKGKKEFNYMDYLSKTPEWALYGNGGFAPGNVREIRKEKKLKNKMLKEQEKEISVTA